MELGYTLSSEETGPRDLVRYAARAEEAGFSFAMISDHFHPWIDEMGHSPFVWSVLGAVAEATQRLRVGTAVTCPTMRIHPALVAQAAASTALLFEGRFMLGVGSGENLNEHVIGGRWPVTAERQEMLREAVSLIRHLWEGGERDWKGEHFTVEDARIYDLPEPLPQILVAVAGPKSARLAAEIGDGLIGTDPQRKLVEAFRQAGGGGRPIYGQLAVCWAETEERAREIAHGAWPLAGVPGPVRSELRRPKEFAAVCSLVTPEQVAAKMPLGPDPAKHAAAVVEFARAGFDHVWVHQVGPDQDGFFRFYEREVLPQLQRAA
ncbi:MAG TPA: TIGR03557 family F420-dependent LLM class oxidoreductase [Candidatus Dormibacteraeota bacterium]